mmetsp:Transcript_143117/g.398776  ORF Transcript_143117/g.398776 Transcript_143117/m.398776 type:complete len:216 (-) Transcript_143117:406-1053(-)
MHVRPWALGGQPDPKGIGAAIRSQGPCRMVGLERKCQQLVMWQLGEKANEGPGVWGEACQLFCMSLRSHRTLMKGHTTLKLNSAQRSWRTLSRGAVLKPGAAIHSVLQTNQRHVGQHIGCCCYPRAQCQGLVDSSRLPLQQGHLRPPRLAIVLLCCCLTRRAQPGRRIAALQWLGRHWSVYALRRWPPRTRKGRRVMRIASPSTQRHGSVSTRLC